jgi:xanthine/uracil permease
VPNTSWIGAILLTGYLGGAIASHVRAGEIPKLFIPLILGIVVWLGLTLRHRQLQFFLAHHE